MSMTKEKFLELVRNQLGVVDYTYRITIKQGDLFLTDHELDEFMSWYKSDCNEPFFFEKQKEIIRLERANIIRIQHRPITRLHRIMQPVLCAVASPQRNFVRTFFIISLLFLFLTSGWGYLNGSLKTGVLGFIGLYQSIITVFDCAFLFLFISNLLVSKNDLNKLYWEKFSFIDSLGVQAVMVGILSFLFQNLSVSLIHSI